jgi:putative tricarboxylic transport membrane protein
LQYKKFFIIFGSAILYAFFLEKIGYVLSTFLFLLIAFQTMERGKTVSSIVIAAIFSRGVYFLFSELLGGSLPGFPLF